MGSWPGLLLAVFAVSAGAPDWTVDDIVARNIEARAGPPGFRPSVRFG